MASEIRVNTITDRSGINTITFASSGFAFSGVTTVGILSATGNAQFSANLNVSGTVNGNVNSTGVSTFTNGPVLIGSGTSTGTASQRLQITGGAYVSSSVGIGMTNPTARLVVDGGGLSSIAFRDDSIENHKFDSDTANISINYAGYLGGTTRFRDFYVYNGKYAALLRAVGSTGSILIGSTSETGTASQRLQITGGAYVSGSLGIGTAVPSTTLQIRGDGGGGAGTPGNYRGLIRIDNTRADPWAGISFPDSASAADSQSNNYYFIGRGQSLSDRVLSVHLPTATDYGSGSQPIFGVFSTGSDKLFHIQASTGNCYLKGSLSVTGNTTSNRFTLPYGSVTTYKTNNPASNVFIEGSPNTTDWWLFRDPADTLSNWGIYHRNIDSVLSESGEYSIPGNSISFVGGGTNSPGVTIDLAFGDLQVKRNIKIGNDNIIQWVEVTPGVTEWSWSGAVTSQAITLNPSTIPSTARYVLADVFVTASAADHLNVVLGRSTLTNQKNWVDTRGTQPSTQFGTLTRQAVTLTYHGDLDNYSPNYGEWYSSQPIPCSGRTIYFNNYGYSTGSGWVYVIVRSYSL